MTMNHDKQIASSNRRATLPTGLPRIRLDTSARETRCLLLMDDGRWSGPLRRTLAKQSVLLTTCESTEELQAELQRTPDAAITVELTVDRWEQLDAKLRPLQELYADAIWVGLLARAFRWQPLLLRQQGWTHLHQDPRQMNSVARLIRMHAERRDIARADARTSAATLHDLQLKIDSQLPWRDSP